MQNNHHPRLLFSVKVGGIVYVDLRCYSGSSHCVNAWYIQTLQLTSLRPNYTYIIFNRLCLFSARFWTILQIERKMWKGFVNIFLRSTSYSLNNLIKIFTLYNNKLERLVTEHSTLLASMVGYVLYTVWQVPTLIGYIIFVFLFVAVKQASLLRRGAFYGRLKSFRI